MSQPVDLIIRPSWVVHTEPDVVAEPGVSVAVNDGRIVAVMDDTQLQERYSAGVVHERPGQILMPGLVNAHCHAGMCLMRGFADDMPLERWLGERIWPAESRWVTREFVADGTRIAIAEMLLGGTTCFGDMYYFPDVVAEISEAAGMRSAVGMIALETPTAWAQNADEYIEKGLAVHDASRSLARVTTTFAPHAPYSVSDETFARIRRLADELDVPVHVHVHETAGEVAAAVVEHGERPLARLARLGLVTPALMAVHATELDAEEIALLARERASVVHCPRSNLKLASGACPVADLLEAGVNVALGTDGAASNNRLDMFAELQLAALLGKLVAADASAVSAAQALQMATINGARALGLDEHIGSIEVGKNADIICVELDTLHQLPVLDPISHLVYTASRDQVSDVWIAGEQLVSRRRLQRMPVESIAAQAAAWAARIRTPQ
jgi:5-methylthioadenosine/S-adenosylhomocysteine deaminase